MADSAESLHYLEREVLDLIRSDVEVFRFVESSTLDGMWYWDLEDPEHEWMSATFWERFGYDPSEKGHFASEWQDMIHPGDLALAIENFEKHCADPSHPYDQTVRYRHKDGSTVWVRCRGKAIRDDEGKPIRMLGVHVDVTEIMQRKEQLRAFIESLPGMAFVFDEDGRYLQIMETGLAKRSAGVVDRVGKAVHDYVPAEVADRIVATIREAIERRGLAVTEYCMALDGRDRWFEGRAVPMSSTNERSSSVVWIANEITDRKLSELELLRRNEELQQFAYASAHDLQAPIRGIEHLGHWLLEALDEGDVEQCREHAETILGRASRMQRLLTGLLQYASMRREESLVATELSHVVESAIELATRPERDVRIVVESELPSIVSDPLLLQQILQNLFSNSIKYHDRDTGRVTIRYESAPGKHLLFVEDDGPGIPKQFHGQVFKMFQTLKPKDQVEATGIGLALVHKAVGELGGTVSIDDTEGRGTTFRIELPELAERVA